MTTRLLKAECLDCGYTVRVTNKWLAGKGAPICPCNLKPMIHLPGPVNPRIRSEASRESWLDTQIQRVVMRRTQNSIHANRTAHALGLRHDIRSN